MKVVIMFAFDFVHILEFEFPFYIRRAMLANPSWLKVIHHLDEQMNIQTSLGGILMCRARWVTIPMVRGGDSDSYECQIVRR